MECTGDWSLGAGRMQRLRRVQTCDPEGTKPEYRRCRDAYRDLTCAQVDGLGDDLHAWAQVDESCVPLFDTTPQTTDRGGTTTADTGPPIDTATTPPTCDASPYSGGCALHLEGGVVRAGAPAVTDALTLELHFLPDPGSNPDRVGLLSFGWADCNGLDLGTYVQRAILATDAELVGGPDLALDQRWHHLAATWDGTTWTLYVDGASVGTQDGCAVVANPLRVGALRDEGGRFTGWVDGVRVWNVVRSPEELQASAHQPLLGTEAGLVLNYEMDALGDYFVDNSAAATLDDLGLSGFVEDGEGEIGVPPHGRVL